MSKRGNDNDSEFWKKIRLGATAVVTVGTGMFAAASVLKHQGMGANFFDEVKAAMQAPPQHILDMTPGMEQPTDDEESQAVLQMQLEFARKRNDTQRVEQIQHQLRMLNSNATQSSNMPTQTTQIQMAHMKMPQIHLPNMQMPPDANASDAVDANAPGGVDQHRPSAYGRYRPSAYGRRADAGGGVWHSEVKRYE